MKKTKTNSLIIGKIALVALMSLIGYTNASATSIEAVEVVGGKEVRVTLTWASLTSSEITGDVKTLKDVGVEEALKSLDSDKIVNITLAEELAPNSSYSLLSIFGSEGNMEFTLGEQMTNVEFMNTSAEASQIEKLVVRDSKNIDVYYKLGLASNEFEYKILSNTAVETMKVEEGVLVLTLKNDLVSNSNYILMILSLKDDLGNAVALEDGLFDFTTGEIIPTVEPVVEEAVTESGSTMPEEAVVTEELNAAAEEVVPNVEEVAMQAEVTPDTGTETWMLLLATFLFNNVYFIVKRRRQKMA